MPPVGKWCRCSVYFGETGKDCTDRLSGGTHRLVILFPFLLLTTFQMFNTMPVLYRLWRFSEGGSFQTHFSFYSSITSLLLLFNFYLTYLNFLKVPKVVHALEFVAEVLALQFYISVLECLIIWSNEGIKYPLNPWMFKYPQLSWKVLLKRNLVNVVLFLLTGAYFGQMFSLHPYVLNGYFIFNIMRFSRVFLLTRNLMKSMPKNTINIATFSQLFFFMKRIFILIQISFITIVFLLLTEHVDPSDFFYIDVLNKVATGISFCCGLEIIRQSCIFVASLMDYETVMKQIKVK